MFQYRAQKRIRIRRTGASNPPRSKKALSGSGKQERPGGRRLCPCLRQTSGKQTIAGFRRRSRAALGREPCGCGSWCSEGSAPSPLLPSSGEDAPLSSGQPGPGTRLREELGLRLLQNFRFGAAAGATRDSRVQLPGAWRSFPELRARVPLTQPEALFVAAAQQPPGKRQQRHNRPPKSRFPPRKLPKGGRSRGGTSGVCAPPALPAGDGPAPASQRLLVQPGWSLTFPGDFCQASDTLGFLVSG